MSESSFVMTSRATTHDARFCPPTAEPVWLASRSPRRRRLLEEAGVPVAVRPAAIEDGHLVRGRVSVEQWVAALAHLKARWVAGELTNGGIRAGTVLGADTLCVHRGELLGQPRDEGHARSMLRMMRDDEHHTLTGVCLISLETLDRWWMVDQAAVRFGPLDDEAMECYLATGAWQGKAGAYNLQDRWDEGWEISCAGDPATVMGLPVRRLEAWFGQVRPDPVRPPPVRPPPGPPPARGDS